MRDKKSNNGASPFSIVDVALILLCVVLISGHLMGGIYARYATEDSGGDSARVISFGNLTVTEENDLLLVPGCSIQRQTYVSFDGSEAQTYVFVHITFEAPWSWTTDDTMTAGLGSGSEPTLKVADGWTKLPDRPGVFYKTLEPNEKVNKASVFADDGKIKLPAANVSPLANSAISVEVIAVQANGFENVQKAWDAVGGKT